ncbi:MAG: DUF1801 domain-containing protein [Acidobacteria bacterium]|nr:DUF1801 domain-containing protein [Acidobacteriota bacterium]MCL5289029.1 DUF1801 domain-containing protein [Acidobacteriota bacterium]
MQSKAKTVSQYLAALPADRRKAIEQVRAVIHKHLPKGYEEIMQYGMIGYAVPLKIYPAGYHCKKNEPLPFLLLASQKNHMALHMFCLYLDEKDKAQFQKEYKASGKKLDMGGGCVRFKKPEDLALDVIGKAIARRPVKKHIEVYEKVKS